MPDNLPTTSAEHTLQSAIFEILSQDQLLISALGGAKVYDRAPEDASFPYIAFANLTTRDGSTASELGFECRFTLNIWSRHQGKQEVFVILQHVRRLLHDQSMNLPSHRLVNFQEEFVDIGQDRDRLTYRGTQRFRAFIEVTN